MNIIDKISAEQLQSKGFPEFSPGDTVRVHHLIQEGGKERVQIFEGVVLKRKGTGINESFTIRKVSYNVGVERVFPLHSPRVAKIEVKQKGKVRRARLYYLRDLSGKKARIEEDRSAMEQSASAKDTDSADKAPKKEKRSKSEKSSGNSAAAEASA